MSRTGIGWQPFQIQGDPLYPSESQRSQIAPAQPRRQAHRVLFVAQWMLPSTVPVGLQWPHGVTARKTGSVQSHLGANASQGGLLQNRLCVRITGCLDAYTRPITPAQDESTVNAPKHASRSRQEQ